MARMRRNFNILILTAFACSALPAGVWAQQQPSSRNSVQQLDYAMLGGRTVIRLIFREELKDRPRVIATYHPAPNIAMDFDNFSSVLEKDLVEVGQRDVRSIQVLPGANRVRVVIKLTRPVPYEMEIMGRELLITLHRPVSAG
jgi:type IV pilus assembly protein PilQ